MGGGILWSLAGLTLRKDSGHAFLTFPLGYWYCRLLERIPSLLAESFNSFQEGLLGLAVRWPLFKGSWKENMIFLLLLEGCVNYENSSQLWRDFI